MNPTRHLQQVRDLRIERTVPVITPAQLLEELPLSDEQAEVVLRGRDEIGAILDRAGRPPAGRRRARAASTTSRPRREYAERLAARSAELRDDLCIAMRVYFEKPRTTTGWKGMINDPHLDGSGDVNAGVRMARGLLLDVLALGLPVGCEWLDPITPQYISDTVAWGAIGARTAESQTHRQLGSGLSMPVGLQEPHRRQRPGGGRRRARRRRPARLRRRRRGRQPGDPAHARQPRLPRHPARRPRGAQLRRRGGGAARSRGCARPTCPSGS